LVGETTLISLSRLMALQRRLDVAANNVANSQTTGYRAQQLSFQEYLKPEKPQEIGEKPERPLSLVDAVLPFTSSSSGAFRSTGNPLDLAINGNAYFAIQTKQGERYTRDGSFGLDANGRLVTLEGLPVLGDKGVIIVPPRSGEITIDSSGRVLMQQVELGKLKLVSFAPGVRLEAAGRNLLRSDQQPKVNAGSATVLQAMLEQSNVQPTIEMSRLAELNRSYEVASKLLKDSQDINEISKLANVPE